jgi:hypothetical protein
VRIHVLHLFGVVCIIDEGLSISNRLVGVRVIAIAHHRMGNAEDSVHAFEQSQTLLDRLLEESVEQSQGSPTIPWVDWIEFLTNHRQASIVVKGHTPAVDPRFRQMRSFAEAMIAN